MLVYNKGQEFLEFFSDNENSSFFNNSLNSTEKKLIKNFLSIKNKLKAIKEYEKIIVTENSINSLRVLKVIEFFSMFDEFYEDLYESILNKDNFISNNYFYNFKLDKFVHISKIINILVENGIDVNDTDSNINKVLKQNGFNLDYTSFALIMDKF